MLKKLHIWNRFFTKDRKSWLLHFSWLSLIYFFLNFRDSLAYNVNSHEIYVPFLIKVNNWTCCLFLNIFWLHVVTFMNLQMLEIPLFDPSVYSSIQKKWHIWLRLRRRIPAKNAHFSRLLSLPLVLTPKQNANDTKSSKKNFLSNIWLHFFFQIEF